MAYRVILLLVSVLPVLITDVQHTNNLTRPAARLGFAAMPIDTIHQDRLAINACKKCARCGPCRGEGLYPGYPPPSERLRPPDVVRLATKICSSFYRLGEKADKALYFG